MFITKEQAIKQGVNQHFGVCHFHEDHPDQEGIKNCVSCRVIINPCGCDIDMECSRCMTKPVRKFITENKAKNFQEAILNINWRKTREAITFDFNHKRK